MGMILDIKKFAIHDGPGIRTTVFFKGCPLDCWWCQNPESRRAEPEAVFRLGRCIRCGRCAEACPRGAISMNEVGPVADRDRCALTGACAEACPTEAREILGREMTVDAVMDEVRKDVVFYEESGGGVTFSGGEPLMQPQFTRDLLHACREESIHAAVDTTGYASAEMFREAVAEADLLLYDLKLMDDAAHREYCGASNATILDNLRALADDRRTVIVRVPLIPGINDGRANMTQMAEFVSALQTPYPIDILPYERRGLHKYSMLDIPCRMGETPPPWPGRVSEAVGILGGFGLTVTVRGEAYGSQ